MLNTVLFDLDGTLLPMDMDEFLKHYLSQLSNRCSGKINPKDFQRALWSATEYMVKNLEGNKTNMEAFMEHFKKQINVSLEEILPIIDEFYKVDFKNLKFATNPRKTVKEIVQVLKEKGYPMVVATNPLFPRQAILHRIDWAGLDPKDFCFITDYETMHYCKPHIEFYQEVLSNIDKDPSTCLMVGNDVQEDMVAAKLGIKTFLIEDYIINREQHQPKVDYRGSYGELLDFAKNLPNLKD